MAFTHILVPTDFSDQAQAALAVALREAELHQASLTLMHVLNRHTHTEVTYIRGNPADQQGMVAELGPLQATSQPEPVVLRRDYVEEALMRLRELVPHDFARPWDVKVGRGDPADAVLHAAQEAHVDLIVMGTHGRTGLAHVFLGSVAEKVVRQAACPVLVARCQSVASDA